LSREKKELVQQEISGDEYQELRQQHLAFESSFKENTIAPPVSDNLLRKTKNNRTSILNWKIKVPYVAAALLLAFGGGYLSSNSVMGTDKELVISNNQSWAEDTLLTSLIIPIP
jgi:hypothetical protein